MNRGRLRVTSIAVAFTACIMGGPSNGAEGTFQWEKMFGGSSYSEGSYSVQQTADGGYIMAGNTSAGYNVYIVKTNSDGDAVWEKTFGGSASDSARSVQQTTDGGYIVAGQTSSYGSGGSDVYLVKTDADGQRQWQKTFGGSSGEAGYSVQQTTDGGYIIAGFSSSYGSGGNDSYLVKADSNGDLLWEKTFGGSGSDWGYCVQETSDNGYIISGETSSYGSGGSDVYLVKTDSTGGLQWEKTFGGSAVDRGYSVRQTSDGGYVISGFTHSYGAGGYDVYLVKTNADGDLQWETTFGGSGSEVGYSVQQTSDEGYIVTGYTGAYPTDNTDVYLVKAYSDGDLQWEYTFGGSAFDEGQSVQQTSDGGYVVAGSTRSTESGYSDAYLIKISGDAPPPTISYELLSSSGEESVSPAILSVALSEASAETVTVDYSVAGGTAAGGGVDYTLSAGTLTFSPGDRSEDISVIIVDDLLDEVGESIIVTLSNPVNAGLGVKTTHTFTILDDDIAVEGDLEWEKAIGGNSVRQTSDSGYILVGGGMSLAKTDADGELQWQKTFGWSLGDTGKSVQQTSDGGYIITGRTDSDGEGNYDLYLLKTNAGGEQLWQTTYGGSGYDEGWSVEQTLDGGYVVVGFTYSAESRYDVYLIKTNANGDLQWERTFDEGIDDRGYSVQQSSDGGYIIAGSTWSSESVSDDVYLVKTDPNGDLLWRRHFGGSLGVDNGDCGYSVQQTSDGGYVVTGYTYSHGLGINDRNVYLAKTDSDGYLLWERAFGGAFGSDDGYCVQQTPDSGYIIVGTTSSFGAGETDVYLVKTDADGFLQWQKTFGGTGYDSGRSVQLTSDGGYIIVGTRLIKVSSAELTVEAPVHDWNGDGIVSIIGDVPPFVQCVYFSNCSPGVDTLATGDCNHDGILSIIGDVPCFVQCVYFGNCPE